MKILFVTDLYPVKIDENDTPKTLCSFVESWRKSGENVFVLKPNFILNSFLRKKPFYKTAQYEDVLNVNYWTPFLFDVKKKIANVSLSISTQLSRHPERREGCLCPETPDLIVSHMPSGTLFVEKLGLDVPYVVGVHNSDLEILTNPLYAVYFKNRLKTALKKAIAVSCRSEILKKKLLSLMPELSEKTFTAPSGVAENLIVRREPLQNRSDIKVLTCAKLIKRKNIDKVVKALKGVEGCSLTVIGEGAEKAYLKSLDAKVNFTGFLPQEEVYKKMRESDIFILPSVGETFGMVYLEAMAAGCIVVGTKDDGVDGIIKNGENGFLTAPNSDEIRNIVLNLKNIDDDSLKALSYNSFKTINEFIETKINAEYLQQILKFL